MGGVFINYRRGQHEGAVWAVYERLVQHFGADQVFLDKPSIVPGERYPNVLRERVADCDVLLAVIHAGWAAEKKNERGDRLLYREDDWVRLEIETALRTGKTVIPLVLHGGKPPLASELPESLREFALKNAHFMTRMGDERWVPTLEELIRVLEAHVAPTWQPYPMPEPDRRRHGGHLLAVATAVAAVALPLVAAWLTRTGVGNAGPLRSLTMGSIGSMSVVLLLSCAFCGPLRHQFNRAEQWLHRASERKYLLLTSALPLLLILLVLFTAFSLWNGRLKFGGVVLIMAVAWAVMQMAVRILKADKKEQNLRTRWPVLLPKRVPRRVLRRAIARLEERADQWKHPLTREQRDKATLELEQFERAVATMKKEAERSRLRWLSEDMPLQFSVYVLWISVNTALAWVSAPSTTVRVVVGVSACLALGTMETLYRHQRWLRQTVSTEIALQKTALGKQFAELSSPARTKPSEPSDEGVR
ncbi:toll/interleukin-1 receptor domain-containing protein [Streptomyces sp. HC307]|uniref:toll/interleukin-1 receptor domain-containing protein n=1 Tax=Streptomyces flavusporus TaxID=3385496 RepID=UPI0039170B3B